MKIGLFLSTQFPEGEDVAARIPDLVAQVRAARDSGFASLWLPHHYLTAPMQMLQLTPLLAYLLPEAKGMEVGPGILILPLLNPVHVAEEAATLHTLSGGKYVLGVGLGYREGEFTAFGMALSERAARFNEAIALMRRLWTEPTVTHEGRFYTVREHGLSLRPHGAIPVWIAAQAEPALRRAARIGDAWLIVPSATLPEVAAQMRIYRAALAEYGRHPAASRSSANAMSAKVTRRRWRSVAARSNTNTPPMPPGGCAARPPFRSRISRASASSSATRHRWARRSRAIARRWGWITSSCACNGRDCRRSGRSARSGGWGNCSAIGRNTMQIGTLIPQNDTGGAPSVMKEFAACRRGTRI